MVWLTKLQQFRDETYNNPIIGAFGLGEITAAFLIIGVPAVPRILRGKFSQDSAVRYLLSRIKLLSWTGKKRPAEAPDGGSGRTQSQAPWRSALFRKPRGAWDTSTNDTFDLLSVSTVHVDEEQNPAPTETTKGDMGLDVVNERIG